jgi:hypothetical protein
MRGRFATAATGLTWIVAFALLVGGLALATACGGGDDGEGDGEAVATEEPGTEPPPATTTEEPSASSKTYASRQFKPGFTVEYPGAWQEPVEAAGTVQFFSGETSQRVLTFSSKLSGSTVAQAVSRMRGAPNLQPEPAADETVAGSQGQVFGATVGSGYSTDLPGVEYLVIEGFQIKVWTFDVNGSTVVVIADSPAAESEAFLAEVEPLLNSLKFR